LGRRRRRQRHFLLQLLPITAGILVALLIDGLVGGVRHWALVNEAHKAIAVEIADNADDLAATLPRLAVLVDDLGTIGELVDDILASGRTNIDSYAYDMPLPSLNRASWQSAERTGALGYMDFARVKEYAELYALQALVEDSQRDLLTRLPTLGVIRQAMDSGDPEGYMQDFQATRPALAEFRDAVGIHVNLAHALAEAYRSEMAAQ
jgi:hypothetical protein